MSFSATAPTRNGIWLLFLRFGFWLVGALLARRVGVAPIRKRVRHARSTALFSVFTPHRERPLHARCSTPARLPLPGGTEAGRHLSRGQPSRRRHITRHPKQPHKCVKLLSVGVLTSRPAIAHAVTIAEPPDSTPHPDKVAMLAQFVLVSALGFHAPKLQPQPSTTKLLALRGGMSTDVLVNTAAALNIGAGTSAWLAPKKNLEMYGATGANDVDLFLMRGTAALQIVLGVSRRASNC